MTYVVLAVLSGIAVNFVGNGVWRLQLRHCLGIASYVSQMGRAEADELRADEMEGLSCVTVAARSLADGKAAYGSAATCEVGSFFGAA